jgi:antitoxin component of MazEF toxin-antitoxin module
MEQKIIRTGNSAAVTIPSEFFKGMSLRIGDVAKAKMDYQKARITYTFPGARQMVLVQQTQNPNVESPKKY